MKNFPLLVLFLLFNTVTKSQTFESGFSSIASYYNNSKESQDIIPSNNLHAVFPLAININTKDKQIDARNSYLIPLNPKKTTKKVDVDILLGHSLGGKMDNSIASVFKDNNIAGGFKAGGIIGIRLQQSSKVFQVDSNFNRLLLEYHNSIAGSDDREETEKELINYVSNKLHNGTYWLYFAPTWEGRDFKQVDSLTSVDFEKKKNTIRKFSFGLSTFQDNLPLNLMGLFDISIKVNKDDNFSSLEEISSAKQFSQTTNGVASSNKESFTSYYGEYQSNITSKDISFETYLVSKKLPLFGFYLNPTYNFNNSHYSPTINLNYTIYYLKPNKSFLAPDFGLVFSHQDLLKSRDELFKNGKSRFTIGIVTKLNIGEWFN